MNIHWVNWSVWGFIATLVMITTEAGSQGLGLTRMSIPYILGTMATPDRNRAKAYGSLLHFLNGWVISFVYILAFHSLGWATWWLGLLAGIVHGLFVLTVVLSLLPGIHPRMASEQYGPTAKRQLEPPGFLGLHYGIRTPISVLLSHAAFGAILGAFYKP